MLAALSAAVEGHRGSAAADRLCEACVQLFDVDAAAISLIVNGSNSGTLGASSPRAREYDELQFTLGEGPCLESVARRGPVLVADLGDIASDIRWPAYAPALLDHRVCSVFAMPVVLAGEYVGALDLYRSHAGALEAADLTGALSAAELAALPLLDLLADDLRLFTGDPDTATSAEWNALSTMTRVEVSQATGMLMGQLDIDASEALVRLRAHAFAADRSATAVARAILDHKLYLAIDPKDA